MDKVSNLRSHFVILQYNGSNWAITLRIYFEAQIPRGHRQVEIKGYFQTLKTDSHYYLLVSNTISNKEFQKTHGLKLKNELLTKKKIRSFGSISLTFKADNYSDFLQNTPQGCFLRENSAEASLTPGICYTIHVETLYFPFPLYLTLLHFCLFHIAFYFTLTRAYW